MWCHDNIGVCAELQSGLHWWLHLERVQRRTTHLAALQARQQVNFVNDSTPIDSIKTNEDALMIPQNSH